MNIPQKKKKKEGYYQGNSNNYTMGTYINVLQSLRLECILNCVLNNGSSYLE